MRGCAAGRKEDLFTVDAIGHNRVETSFRCEPLMPSPRFGDLHMGPFGGVYENAAIAIE